ncbi:TPA: steryl acetyl hydrolase [Streptococcus suis]|nr:steryl acetyl hydrolase [Streptococcus suis]HEM5295119.1 steryl acetyl hydrolase [Streptococcus suis]HEM5308385.1 steryl acetyl hydrolase [Streptococcus suis]
MGESAGGTLSLDLGLKLRDGNHILPRAIIALFPTHQPCRRAPVSSVK